MKQFLSRTLALVGLVICCSFLHGQTKFNPNSQIRWPAATGSGAPSATCQAAYTAANTVGYGTPYTDTTNHNEYFCGLTGWIGPFSPALAYTASSPTTPAWLQYLGTGADGANTCTGTLAAGEYYFTTFTVPVGNTCTVSYQSGVVIHATGACTINGSFVGMNTSSPNGPVYLYISASGGGGGGTAAGVVGGPWSTNPGGSTSGAGTAGAASGGAGGNGSAANTQTLRAYLDSAFFGYAGQYVTGRTGGAGGSSGGAGGWPSAPIVLICGSITGTGSITSAGQAGGNSPGNNQGAGAGGSGGVIILSSQATETFSGLALSVAAGAPGSCLSFTGCGTPGTSASGILAEFSGW